MALTTTQKTQAALDIPCPWHRVAKGVPCPVGLDGPLSGACMDRREAAKVDEPAKAGA